MKSNKSHGELTAQIQVGEHKKSGFDLSNNNYGSGQIGRIIPTRALHVMPGDTIHQDSKVAVQFEPLAVPILANMDVKQEHFYVPYNVVWKNWDKFISGGERMDYNGVVPNVSMADIVHSVFNYLPTITFNFQKSSSDDKVYAITNLIDFYKGDINAEIAVVGSDWQINDILRPQYEVIKMIRDRVLTDSNWLNNALYSVAGSSTIEHAYGNYDSYLSKYGLVGDKYLAEIREYIVTKYLAFGNVLLPTDEMLEMLHYCYDYFKPFIGYGSNIDYLNMNRISFVDFLLIFINDIYNLTSHSVSIATYNLLNASAVDSYVSTKPMSVLHLRANYSVWYNNYRDILLEANAAEPIVEDEVSSTELFTLLVPRQRCWEKDTFTTALDNPGTGNVHVPVKDNGALTLNMLEIPTSDKVAESGVDNDMEVVEISFNGEKTWKVPTAFLRGLNETSEEEMSNSFSLYALDAAQRAQKWLQKALYFGNRISDFYYLRFGVRFLDSRLRLPELLSSSSELVKIDVLMNNTTTSESIAGDRAGYASAYDNGNSFERFCEEHGVIMSYMTIMPQISYAYGSCRDYSRLDQFDFAFSEFATLGMDAIYTDEITASPLKEADKTAVFGYQGKYYDYKAKQSEEHGELLDTQDMYTFARKFNMLNESTTPKLNYEFVHCFPSLDMFVVDSPLADYFRYDIRHSTAAERNLPSQSIYI